MRSLNTQINYMLDHQRRELEYLPKAVADGKMSQVAADAVISTVQDIITTLQMRQVEEAVSRRAMRDKGFNAGLAGGSRDSHCMNPSPALTDWLVGYDKGAGVRQASQYRRIGAERIDARQAAQ